MTGQEGGAPRKWESTARVEAISDGLFAVALTLLVLDIKVPHAVGPGAALSRQIWALLPHLGLYAASFLVVGFYWVAHTLVFGTIERSDRWLLWINLLYLLPVAFLPFATQLLAEYPQHRSATMFYGADVFLVGLMQFALWVYAVRGRRLIPAEAEPGPLRAGTRRLALMPLSSLAGVFLALLSPPLSLAVFVLTPLVYIVTGKPHGVAGGKLPRPRG